MADEPVADVAARVLARRSYVDDEPMTDDAVILALEVARLTGVVSDVMTTARNARISEGVALLRIADITARALLRSAGAV